MSHAPLNARLPVAATLLVALVATVALVAITPPGAHAAGVDPESVLDPGRYYASPVGAVAWLDVDRERLLMSDLSHGVAAVDRASGALIYNHAAHGGRLDRLWRVRDQLVLAGPSLEVLSVADGQTTWRQPLPCTAPERCARAVHAGSIGVLVLRQGPAVATLELLSLAKGERLWQVSAPFGAPATVHVSRDAVALRDGGSPTSIRFYALVSGRPRGTWTWPEDRAPPPTLEVTMEADGTTLLVAPRAEGDALFEVAIIRAYGRDTLWRRVTPPEGRPELSAWVRVHGRHTLWAALGQDGAARWLGRAALEGAARLVVEDMGALEPPHVRGDRLLVHHHDGARLVASGYDAINGQRDWRLSLGAPARSATWWDAGGAAMLVVDSTPAPVLLVAPHDGRLLAAGALPAAASPVAGVAFDDEVLHVAAGRGVWAHRLVPTETWSGRVREALADNDLEEAEALHQHVAWLSDASPAIFAQHDAVTEARVLAIRARASASDAAGAVDALTAAIQAGGVGASGDLAALAPHVASLVGDLFLAGGRPSAPATGALARLADTIAAGVRIHGARFTGRALHRSRQVHLRAAVVVVAAALSEGGLSRTACDLLSAWSAHAFDPEPGLTALHRALAVDALTSLLDDLGAALLGDDGVARHRAARTLAEFPHVALALPSVAWIADRIQAVLSPEPARSRMAAQWLDGQVRVELRRARDTLGPALGEPGCAATCRALGDGCLNGCRSVLACAEAARACAGHCPRTGQVGWKPPRGLPVDPEEAAACFGAP